MLKHLKNIHYFNGYRIYYIALCEKFNRFSLGWEHVLTSEGLVPCQDRGVWSSTSSTKHLWHLPSLVTEPCETMINWVDLYESTWCMARCNVKRKSLSSFYHPVIVYISEKNSFIFRLQSIRLESGNIPNVQRRQKCTIYVLKCYKNFFKKRGRETRILWHFNHLLKQ